MRGVLNKEDLNTVQEQMLLAVMYRKRKSEFELEQAHFERDMFIMNPMMYSEYKKQQEEEIASGNTGVTWVAPESIEEARELMNVFADIEEQLSKDPDDRAADEDFVKQVSFINLLGDINIDEIGE
jgi:hypothetical protein